MASFYKIQPRATAFVAFLFKKLGWKNIGEARIHNSRFFLVMKDNQVYELKLIKHENTEIS